MKEKRIAILLVFMLFLLAACGASEEAEPNEKMDVENDRVKVYTTIYPLEFFTEQIGGELVEVVNIIPVGADAHTYEPTAKTLTEVANGDVFIYNGAGIEGFADALLSILQKENVQIVKAVEGLTLRPADEEHDHEEDGHDHDHGDFDPHVWLDPILSIQIAENIKNALIEQLPNDKETLEANFLSLSEELTEIDKQFQEMIKNATKDEFLVSHAGYGYWEDRYGIKQISVTGLSPTNEPSVKHMEEIITKAKELNASYIAFEKNLPVKVAETIQKEANLQVVYLYNLESIVEENKENGENYFDLMRKNIESLQLLLQ